MEVAEHQLIVYQQQLEYGDLGQGEVKRKVSSACVCRGGMLAHMYGQCVCGCSIRLYMCLCVLYTVYTCIHVCVCVYMYIHL